MYNELEKILVYFFGDRNGNKFKHRMDRINLESANRLHQDQPGL